MYLWYTPWEIQERLIELRKKYSEIGFQIHCLEQIQQSNSKTSAIATTAQFCSCGTQALGWYAWMVCDTCHKPIEPVTML